MNQNELFEQTRWRLAWWYAGVMGVILSVCGLGVYEAIAHAHRITLDREIASVASTLHNSLEPLLEKPGQLQPSVQRFLPAFCAIDGTSEENCQVSPPKRNSSQNHVHGAIERQDYYVRFLNSSGTVVAVAGMPASSLPVTSGDRTWQTLADANDIRYRQISLTLYTENDREWGYLQVGRSLEEWDNYLSGIEMILVLGLPLALLLVGGASWWLAGIAMQPIYQSYQQIQQFTADAAHELRTPLAAIRATVESTLRMNRLSEEEARDTLLTIERQNHRLSQLVKDLLLLSRMDRQALPVKHTSCCLNDLISDVEEELAVWAMNAYITLEKEIRVAEPLFVVGNQEQLYRMVFNLVSNSIQYTLAGGKVTLILESLQNYALIHIKDTGIGIPPVEQTRIFDRFYRVNSDRSRYTGGAGLGLAIARAIAQTHNGTIQVQSELGKGSIFTIRLPLSRKSETT